MSVTWIDAKERLPQPGEMIAKRWRRTGAVWAGIYTGSKKESSFDEWVSLEDRRLSLLERLFSFLSRKVRFA